MIPLEVGQRCITRLGSIERELLMAVFSGYFDESGKKGDHPVVAFAGVCAGQSKLLEFEDAWKTLLRQYGMRSLHMARASRIKEKICDRMPRHQPIRERTEALMPFADCINKHLEIGLIQAIDVEGFNSLSETARKKLGSPDDPYYVAFVRATLELVKYAHGDDRISIICDYDQETAFDCHRHYMGVRKARAEVRQKIISLSFADDEYFPALQAADMVVFLTRLEAKSRFHGTRYDFRNLYDHLTTEKGVGYMSWNAMFADTGTLGRLSRGLDRSASSGR
jgi:hypothetical protein